MRLPPAPELLGLPLGHVGIGECAFALRPMLLTTVLGSCVSATLHHPERKVGGMFHAMLPDKSLRRPNAKERPCLYADMAVDALLERFCAAGIDPGELTVKLFGGANTLQDGHGVTIRDLLDVGRRNVASALACLAAHGLRPIRQDVLGAQSRKIFFSTATGEVWLNHLSPDLATQYLAREKPL